MSVVTFASGETEDAVLEGFTIRNGSGTQVGTPQDPLYFGGGIYCKSSSPTITDCTITGNSADSGGGINGLNASALTINNCTITNNSSVYSGGGIFSYSDTITNCIITDNIGTGIDTYHSTIINCTIARNSGGGISARGRIT